MALHQFILNCSDLFFLNFAVATVMDGFFSIAMSRTNGHVVFASGQNYFASKLPILIFCFMNQCVLI